MEDGAYKKLSTWIVAGLPTPATPNMTDTMSMRLLQRFASSLLFAEYPSAADAPPDLRVFWRKVELSFDVLRNLDENTSNSTGGNVSPVSRRKGKTVNRRIDPLPFDSMGIAIPSTDAEVRDVYVRVLSQLQSVLEVWDDYRWPARRTKPLQYYLLVLRSPLLSEIFGTSYHKAKQLTKHVSSPTKKAAMGQDQARKTLFPMVQPMKAALYFDDIEGFGEWAILLSTQAQKDLRTIKRSDGAMFRIVIKKIRWVLTHCNDRR